MLVNKTPLDALLCVALDLGYAVEHDVRGTVAIFGRDKSGGVLCFEFGSGEPSCMPVEGECQRYSYAEIQQMLTDNAKDRHAKRSSDPKGRKYRPSSLLSSKASRSVA
jgi:hypothetical protein